MAYSDEEFLQQLLAAFSIEADEHLHAISAGLLDLEKDADAAAQLAILETIYRETHSLKGAARAVNQRGIETMCQELESVFAQWKKQQHVPAGASFDVLFRTVDALNERFQQLDAAETVEQREHHAALVRQLATLKAPAPAAVPATPHPADPVAGVTAATPASPCSSAAPPVAVADVPSAHYAGKAPVTPVSDTMRVATEKIDTLFHQVEDMLAIKLSARQLMNTLDEVTDLLDTHQKDVVRRQAQMRKIREFVSGQTAPHPPGDAQALCWLLEMMERDAFYCKYLDGKLRAIATSVESHHREVNSMVDGLLVDVKTMLMRPFSGLLDMLPRIARDLAHAEDKDVEVTVSGGEIEIDRRILERLKDPLIHIIRNSIDHGIEPPAEREQHGKPRKGTIKIAITQLDSNKVAVEVSDDGAGFDLARIKAVAVRQQLLTQAEAEAIPCDEAFNFIFQSGFSTSQTVNEISGRGLGLAIVREQVERIGGSIVTETAPGIGTTFRIYLPLTLATFRGILVECAGQTFAVPITYVNHAVHLHPADVHTVSGCDTVIYHERSVPLVPLADMLELTDTASPLHDEEIAIVLLGTGEQQIALRVDRILNEQEILVKNLGKQLSRVRNIAAVTVLGSGIIAPILNVPDLIRTATKTVVPVRPVSVNISAPERQVKTILVAEDSITSRMLLKNILEAAGYLVQTAVDGAEAFAMLKAKPYDLLVSDVEMPKLNGFDLTAKVRNDAKLADLPVILVTSLASTKDRERGLDVGANAYVVKSSFDQDDLLTTIRWLI